MEEQQVQETQEDQSEVQETQEEEQQQTRDSYTREEMEAARKEAANYRTRLRKLEKQSEQQQQAEEQARRAKMEESERLKLEKQEAEQRAQDALGRANKRVINSEARALAASRGVSSERLAYVVRMADLSGVEVDDDGNADTETLTSAIDRVLEDIPEFTGSQTEQRRTAPDMSSTDRQLSPEEATEAFNRQLRGFGG
jgi:hypothetical protein